MIVAGRIIFLKCSQKVYHPNSMNSYNLKPMDRNNIVENLKQQRNRLTAAIEALTGGRRHMGSSTQPRNGGKMSAAGRKRISDAMKARWAKAKKTGKNAL